MRGWRLDPDALSENRGTALSEAEYATVKRFDLHRKPRRWLGDVPGMRYGLLLVGCFAGAVVFAAAVILLNVILGLFR